MVDLENLLNVLPVVSLSIVVVYYAMNVRNANRSRQATLYMQLYNSFRNPDFIRGLNELLYHYEWESYEDYVAKYGVENNIEASTKITSLLLLFEVLGGLLQQGFLDMSVVEKQVATAFIPVWEKMRAVIEEDRKHFNNPGLWDSAEYLYGELTKKGA